jgi:hypothetical protein
MKSNYINKLQREIESYPNDGGVPIDKAVELKECLCEKGFHHDFCPVHPKDWSELSEHIADTGKMIETEDELWNDVYETIDENDVYGSLHRHLEYLKSKFTITRKTTPNE